MAIRNFFISSSDNQSRSGWRAFVVAVATTLAFLLVFCFGFVVLIDPYDSVPFSPDLERIQVDKVQRLFYPALARRPQFDSALIGNSNIRLIKPSKLNQSLGGEWVNLGMNAASSWEQEQIFNVFVENHEDIENIFIGIDYLWCNNRFAHERFVGNNTEAGFPAWLYDKNIINNIPPLNLSTLNHAWLLALTNLGLREKKFGVDGYTVFTDPMSEYSIQKARRKIYGSDQPKKLQPVEPPIRMNTDEREALPISALSRLDAMLDKLPESTRKILFFVPYHSYYQARPGSRPKIIWDECKRRTVDIASRYKNSYVLDFMIRSKITREDANYWDYKHYTVPVAAQVAEMIGVAVNEGIENDNYKVLHTPE
jgi:hypothetical protein